MNILKKFLINRGIVKGRPHEKAELGKGVWGRQVAISKPKSSVSARVIRKDGTIEDLGILTGRK